MTAGDDGVEQQLIQELDALIEEGPDDELAAARGRRTLMEELLRKSPRVSPRRRRRHGGRVPRVTKRRGGPGCRRGNLHEWPQRMAEARFYSMRHPEWRRTGFLFGPRRRRACRPSELRGSERLQAPASFRTRHRRGRLMVAFGPGYRHRSHHALRQLAEARSYYRPRRASPREGFLSSLRRRA